MRTTLTIDDDVLGAARELAAHDKSTIGDVISDLARQSLTRPAPSSDDDFLGFNPLPHRGVIVTNELIDAIREEEGI